MDKLETKSANAVKVLKSIGAAVEFLHSKTDVENLEKQIISLRKKVSDTNDLFIKYGQTKEQLANISKLLNDLNKINLNLVEASDTFKIEARDLIRKASTRYSQLVAESNQIDLQLIPEISADIVKLVTLNKPLEKIDELRAKYKKTPGTVSLYANIMQELIDHYYTTDRPLSFKLLTYISKDKDDILEGQASDLYMSDGLIKKNIPMERFGLLPATACMKLSDLLKIILAEEQKPIDDTDLQTLAKKLNVGFIVFNRILYTPVEFNLRPLIVDSEAKQYLQPKGFGITSKTIERFKTINPLDHTNKWNFTTVVHNKTAEKFYVIETLDGKTYRALAPWIKSNTYGLAKHRVEKILEYDPKIPSRATNYNNLLTKTATKNMFLDKALEMESFDSSQLDVNSLKLQADLTTTVYNAVLDIVKSDYHNNIMSGMEVNSIIHDSRVNYAFAEALVSMYKDGAASDDIKSFNAGKFPLSEVLSSFIVELQTATRRFAREMHNGYSRDPLKPTVFTKHKEERTGVALDKIYSIIKDSIVMIVKGDDNIYTSLHFKYLILNYT